MAIDRTYFQSGPAPSAVKKLFLKLIDLVDAAIAPITTELSTVTLATDVMIFSGATAPVDYTDGTPPATGEGTHAKGSLYLAIDTGKWYTNGGTKAQPVWKIITSAT